MWIAAVAAGWIAGAGCGGAGYNAWAEAPPPAVQTAAAGPGYYGGDEGGDMEADFASPVATGAAEYRQSYASGGSAGGGGGGTTPRRETIAEPEPGGEEQPRYAQAEPPEGEERTAHDGREGPLLIYTADLALAVHQVADKQSRIEALARESGGHLQHRGDAEITIRVPAEAFQSVLAQILELGDVLRRDVSVQDVSEEFHDVQTRIRTLEAMYERVSQLLANASDVEHALAVEQHLERITLQLESLRGRLRFLADRVAFSTITVRFTEQATVTEPRFELPFQWLRSLGLPNLLRLR